MSKKKSGGDKKPKDPNAKKRKATPWKAKQVTRAERALKTLTKLNAAVASKPPGVAVENAQMALTMMTSLHAQLFALPDDWKPAKGVAGPGTSKKLGIGSIVKVKDDLTGDPSAALYTYGLPKDLFVGAEIIGEDGPNKKGVSKYWKVKCVDGTIKVLIKKHAEKYVVAAAEQKAAA